MLRSKKGDTLIEVMLAIGVFSMVAVSVVAVLSSSSSGAETALETTLTREEIDTQADALRFIQTAASADMTSSDDRYNKLWQEIIKNAVDVSGGGNYENILQFAPSSCSARDGGAYDFGALGVKPFIIDPQALGNFATAATRDEAVGLISGIVHPVSSGKLTQTTTYPHLVFGDIHSLSSDESSLIVDTTSSKLREAAGIYIVAVKDPGTTHVADGQNVSSSGKASAYYDFYIRTCWHTTDTDQASTISTVVRLYDPNIVNATVAADPVTGYDITYDPRGGMFRDGGVSARTEHYCMSPTSCTLKYVGSTAPTRTDGYTFLGWADADGNNVMNTAGEVFNQRDYGGTLYAKWGIEPRITFHTSHGTLSNGAQTMVNECPKTGLQYRCTVVDDKPQALPDWIFVGWADSEGGPVNAGYTPGRVINLTYGEERHLYAVHAHTPTLYANGGTFWNYQVVPTVEIGETMKASCPTAGACSFPANEPAVGKPNPSRAGYKLLGYTTEVNPADYDDCATAPTSGLRSPGTNFYDNNDYYAVWCAKNEAYDVILEWDASIDYDAHVSGYRSDMSTFHAYYGRLVGSDVDPSVTIARLDRDCKTYADYTCGTTHNRETFTINTLGGRDYYYFVFNYTQKAGVTMSNNARVTLIPKAGTMGVSKTYYVSDAVGSGGYWTVFAYKNGGIVEIQKNGTTPDIPAGLEY